MSKGIEGLKTGPRVLHKSLSPLLFPKALLFLSFMLLLLPGFVLADCCVYEGLCTSSSVGCPADDFYAGVSCSAMDECAMGCCCVEGRAMRMGACSDPYSFIVNPALSSGSACSCDSTSIYSISGTVIASDGGGVGGVTVSAGNIRTTTANTGQVGYFLLENVPGGPVTVAASDAGCVGSYTIPNLDWHVEGIEVELVCECTPGCDVADKQYCDNDKILHAFDVSVPSQLSEYCMFCADVDTNVCGTFSECRAGDASCPLGCVDEPETDANYDPDCVCDAVLNNGYCPPGCDSSTDVDCAASYDLECGDGFVSYPFETCEPSPANGQLSFCSASACDNCNCVSDESCGNGVIDAGEQCELGNICRDGSLCLDCMCSGQCSDISRKPAVAATFDKETKQVVVSWSLSPACRSLVTNYVLMSCVKDGSNPCTDLATFSQEGTFYRSQEEHSMFVNENTVYGFYVNALYDDGQLATSSIARIATGTEFCMNRGPDAPPEFCMSNRRSVCDDNNNIVTIEDCSRQSLFCSGPDRTGQTVCELSDQCSLCNGLYGMFGVYLDLQVYTDSGSFFCNYEPGRETVAGCYLDKTQSVFPAFYSCGEISSCYDYKSQEACEDPWDPCSMNSDCEWASFEFNPELGGICRPSTPSLQDCTLCDDSEYNWLSPRCTPDVCSLFGSCFYQGAGNSPSCSNSEVHSCLEYDTPDRCVGFGSNMQTVSVDVTYSSQNATLRTGGTHALTPSGDDLGLGKCYWDAVNQKCRRDADGLPVDLEAYTGFDCARSDFFCESDFTDPETTLLPSATGFYPASPKFRYEVADSYPSDRISSFFCLSEADADPCYPSDLGTVQGAEKYFEAFGLSVSGEYNLYYYSQDPAKNLEIVKSALVRVDADKPFIELISPRNESDFATNQRTLPVAGRTATDVSYLCVSNEKSSTKYCINNCQKRGVVGECIGADGLFNISVPIITDGVTTTAASSSITRNIVFEAVDFAGNVYKNTLLGVMYDVQPPDAPTITIK